MCLAYFFMFFLVFVYMYVCKELVEGFYTGQIHSSPYICCWVGDKWLMHDFVDLSYYTFPYECISFLVFSINSKHIIKYSILRWHGDNLLINKPGTQGRLRKGLQIPVDGLKGLTGLTGLTCNFLTAISFHGFIYTCTALFFLLHGWETTANSHQPL